MSTDGRSATDPVVRVRRAVSRHPYVVDLLITVVVLALTLPRDLMRTGFTPWSVVVDLALVLPLIFRRRAPFVVFGVIALVAFTQWATGFELTGALALLVALYAVAAYELRRLAWVAAGVTEVGIVLATLRWAPEGEELAALLLLNGSAAAPFVAGLAARTRRAYLASLEERAARLERERDQQGRIAAAAERARIASELHDVVAHHVSVMVALADGAALTAPRDTESAAAAMRQVSSTGRQALREMRRLLGVLHEDRPDAELAPQPGVADLDALLDGVRATGLPVTSVRTGAPVDISAGAGLVVYRVAQEALTNTLKHARDASGARLELHVGADGLDLDITDDGRSPALAHAAGTGTTTSGVGFGVAGMTRRAEVYGGTLEAGPGPQGGWRVHLHLDPDPGTGASA